MIQVHVENSR